MATWNLTKTKHHVLICNGSSCNKAGAEQLTRSIRAEIMAKGLDPIIHTTRTLCNGRCQDKCVLITYPSGHWYKEMSSEDAPRFVDSLLSGRRVEEKISHTFNGEAFEPTEGTVLGVEKDQELVRRVSKL
ncbi:ferredoxin [Halalkalibacterium halodurans]|uniref:BH0367 protein n=1 Tax=Halalkalibacterium halodurans (strain ATCC BAA-125 / DSM 18197 / FERM 7344 / JCM 9153 / C-125) TaxID=272558 RepID=Q9KFV4_HALH5|nr:ferredoxin [Halalkalibacterium halodurans]MED4125140.1 ferredoxin [Halalkalibacterium halodurans]MED4172830.1 ferredoxin [Halalkalibacterium halodurans]BAB04086.1 BH0367 [Halalkalibacterium halodurans C-125]